ncbi:MAG: transporter, partial [Planctomycetaceae bacterium]|nr:transporter [Planctomycetaceae bacterium]
CRREFPVPSPRLFSFHSPQGACSRCQGTGEITDHPCPACDGNRLNEFALAVHYGGFHPGQLLALTVTQALAKCVAWLSAEPGRNPELSRPWLAQLRERLELLELLGLGYIQLNRSGRSLSSGEAQRLALAATLSVRLVEALYVLDEPTAGLHPQEIEQLIEILRELQARRNSVVVVEHAASLIRSADAVIDLGPGAGPEGGQLIHQGTPLTLLECIPSTTAAYLSGRTTIQRRTKRQPTSWLSLKGIQNRTLDNRDIEFPLGTLCAVTGISGSGKSSLIRDTLFPALSATLGQPVAGEAAGTIRQLRGFEALQVVTYVDQSPPEKSGRSNVATASGMWAEMRAILAATSEAKIRQFTAGTFSFHNARGGRCITCEGLGTLAIDLQFLADLQVTCPDCHGARFRREVLEVKYRGLSVAEILKLTVSQALPFFRGKSRLQRRLKALKDVGLSYLQLGQPIYSLSGGETQRLQLATQMTGRTVGATLYLLDEPARGLHPAEIQGLVNWFDDLLNEGHSLIVIEHRPELIAVADHVVEM